MWTVIYVTHQEEDAQNVQNKLNMEGFLVKVKKIGKMDDAMFELLVLESEADEAHSVINNEY